MKRPTACPPALLVAGAALVTLVPASAAPVDADGDDSGGSVVGLTDRVAITIPDPGKP